MEPPTLVLRADTAQPSSIYPQSSPNGSSSLSIRLIMGTQLYGSNAAWLLLGFIATQTYTYYRCSANEHPTFQILVYGIVFTVVLETAVEGFVAYGFMVSGWGNPLVLNEPSLALAVLTDLQPLFDAIPAIFVQFFFTWRIWSFCMAVCRRKIKLLVAAICLFIILMSICAFTSAIILTVTFIKSIHKPPGATLTENAILIWTVSTAVADVTITVCMMAILQNAKSKSYFGETRDRLSRLLRLTIQTGFLTSILAIPVAPLFFRVHAGVYGLTCYLLGKSYVVSLLANLNARSYHSPSNFTGDMRGDRLSTMVCVSPKNHKSREDDTNTSNGVLSYIRSIARTIHDDLTESSYEDSSSSELESQLENARPPGLVSSDDRIKGCITRGQ